MEVFTFTFNEFQEQTYILYDESNECVIVDPGCNAAWERKEITGFIAEKGLKPVAILNTHCHIDHVFGNQYLKETYDIPLIIHEGELPVLASCPAVASMYGMPYTPSPQPDIFFNLDTGFSFGDTQLAVLFTPGHAPGHISLYHEPTSALISGDVLFRQSIGRTDLPGGNYAQLIDSIRDVLFPLGDDVVVYPGHGPATTIGYEKSHNPFLQ